MWSSYINIRFPTIVVSSPCFEGINLFWNVLNKAKQNRKILHMLKSWLYQIYFRTLCAIAIYSIDLDENKRKTNMCINIHPFKRFLCSVRCRCALLKCLSSRNICQTNKSSFIIQYTHTNVFASKVCHCLPLFVL